MKIDAEGWEGPILRGGDWVHFRPAVLVVEAIQPFSHTPDWAPWEPFVRDECGYLFGYYDGVNRFYLAKECAQLIPAFDRPACILDGFQMYATIEAERRATAYAGAGGADESRYASDRISSGSREGRA